MKNTVKLFIFVLFVSATLVSAKGKYGVIGKVYSTDKALELYGAVQNQLKWISKI